MDLCLCFGILNVSAVVAVLVLAFVFNRRTRLWACKQSSGSIATFQIKSCCVIVLVVLRMKRKWPPGNIHTYKHTYIHTYIQHCCCCCCTVFSNDSPGFELFWLLNYIFWLLNYIFIWTIIAKIIHYYYECLMNEWMFECLNVLWMFAWQIYLCWWKVARTLQKQ